MWTWSVPFRNEEALRETCEPHVTMTATRMCKQVPRGTRVQAARILAYPGRRSAAHGCTARRDAVSGSHHLQPPVETAPGRLERWRHRARQQWRRRDRKGVV